MVALYANTIATAVMVGVIWFVQVVHYPLLAQFGSAQSVAVAEQHQTRTGYVVGLPMLVATKDKPHDRTALHTDTTIFGLGHLRLRFPASPQSQLIRDGERNRA